jgi:hypothetical protein
MNKATMGALAMVLVGSVTFSFTNSLLSENTTKKRVQTHDTTNFSERKSVNATNQIDKTVTAPTPTSEIKDVQTTDSQNTSVNQAELSNEKMSEQPVAVSQNNTVNVSSPSPSPNTAASTITTMPKTNPPSAGTTTTTPAASPAPTTNISTAPTSTTSTVPVTVPAQATSTTTATTNHGQQVAQAAKEKGAAASQQNKKGIN